MVLKSIISNKLSKITQLVLFAGVAAFSSFSFNMPLYANCDSCDHHHHEDPLTLALELETEFWTLVQQHNIEGFSRKLARIFQGLNVDGAYTRAEQITGLASSNLISFTITNPVATRFEDTLVFTYFFTAVGTGLTSGPNLTVWKKHENKWKIVAHSYVPAPV